MNCCFVRTLVARMIDVLVNLLLVDLFRRCKRGMSIVKLSDSPVAVAGDVGIILIWKDSDVG